MSNRVKDSNSRIHYCLAWQVKAGWAGTDNSRWTSGYEKGLDPDELWESGKKRLHSEQDAITLWEVAGSLGLTYRVDANGKPINIDCRLLKRSPE